MRILVTGGAGFIGGHVVDTLVDGGHNVVVLDSLHPRAHTGRPEHLNPGAHYEWGDVTDPEAWARVLPGVQAVSHQAAMVGLGVDFSDVRAYVEANDLGTAAGLWAMHRAKFAGRLVIASSMVVYGEGAYDCQEHGAVRPAARAETDLLCGRFEPRCPVCAQPLTPRAVTEDMALDPRNVYAATKVHQEHLVSAFARDHEVSVAALRYHNVYGPRMPRDTPYAGVASIFRSALESKRPPRVFEDGAQIRDFVHVSDVATSNVAALTTPFDGFVAVNIASGEAHTIGEMAATLTSAMGGAVAPEVTGQFRLGDVRHVFGSPARAREVLGFEACPSGAERSNVAVRDEAAGLQGSSRKLKRKVGDGKQKSDTSDGYCSSSSSATISLN